MLSSPHQKWSHSTCSIRDLTAAVQDESITAIESDILMGTCTSTEVQQPIMAHPPETSSDLSFEKFINITIKSQKHLKLDIKEKECIPPILAVLATAPPNTQNNRMIFLNADILPGPGVRGNVDISPKIFLQPCLEFIVQQKQKQKYAFSLGWKTDCRSLMGYSQQDVYSMKEVISQYSLLKNSSGVVLAVNARVLAKSLQAFDDLLLHEFPTVQLLVWTGTGEPPISNRIFEKIKKHFQAIQCQDRVGFDCQVVSNPVFGLVFDIAVKASGIWWNSKKAFWWTLESMRKVASTSAGSLKKD